MRGKKSPFGGELSGHFYFGENFTCDSGDIAMVSALNLLARSRTPFSALVRDLRRYHSTGEINFHVADKAAAIADLKRRYADGRQDELDGITVEYGDLSQPEWWWFNVRPSNTEPLLALEPGSPHGRARGREEERDRGAPGRTRVMKTHLAWIAVAVVGGRLRRARLLEHGAGPELALRRDARRAVRHGARPRRRACPSPARASPCRADATCAATSRGDSASTTWNRASRARSSRRPTDGREGRVSLRPLRPGPLEVVLVGRPVVAPRGANVAACPAPPPGRPRPMKGRSAPRMARFPAPTAYAPSSPTRPAGAGLAWWRCRWLGAVAAFALVQTPKNAADQRATTRTETRGRGDRRRPGLEAWRGLLARDQTVKFTTRTPAEARALLAAGAISRSGARPRSWRWDARPPRATAPASRSAGPHRREGSSAWPRSSRWGR
jgi:hypothetical protein